MKLLRPLASGGRSAVGRAAVALAMTLLAASIAITHCAPATPLPRGDGVSLVVMVVVDQMRGEYLQRFRHLYKGGLAYLLDNGVVFSDAHHNHAMTATAPGHAALSTGMEPARSGIVGNSWFDRATGEDVYSAGRSQSPVNLKVTAIGDWLKRADPRAKVFTASPKDRSAVMLGGQQPDAAYWYDRTRGTWRSSQYYRGADREWMTAFHDQRLLDQYFGTAWIPLVGEHAWPEAEVGSLDRGAFDWGFPYVFGGPAPVPGSSYYDAIYSSPYMDWYLLQFAKALVQNEDLGQDGSIDFLGLSFAALDAVGHAYGPNSPEVLDVLCRLDLYLQELFDFLDQQVGLEHVIVALSADHGVVPLPEYRAIEQQQGRRLGARDVLCMQGVGARLDDRLGADEWLLKGFYLNEETITRRGLTKAEVEKTLAALVVECEAVQQVWTSTGLQSSQPGSDPVRERFRNNYYPGRSPDLIVQLRPYYLYYPGTGTTHGSVYDYDSRVPLVILAPGVTPRRIEVRVSTVDLAPTLARMVGLEAPPGLDGVDLTPMLETAAVDW